MTAIRLDRPFAPQPSVPGSDQARRAFFGQALEPAQALAKPAEANTGSAAVAQPQAAAPPERLARPGALLDIRV